MDSKKKYYMFNKPSGCVTACVDDTHQTVMDYFKDIDINHLHPVGRLDLDTEGLLLVTNDGKWNNYLMSPESHVSKKYLFYALGSLSENKLSVFNNGIFLNDSNEQTKPAKIEIIDTLTLDTLPDFAKGIIYGKLRHNLASTPVTCGYITIVEGKKHQVKRMLKSVGCFVIYLKRVQIGNLVLDHNLLPGEFKEISKNDI